MLSTTSSLRTLPYWRAVVQVNQEYCVVFGVLEPYLTGGLLYSGGSGGGGGSVLEPYLTGGLLYSKSAYCSRFYVLEPYLTGGLLYVQRAQLMPPSKS